MKCAAMQKKKKPRRSREEREAWDILNRRYIELRMCMNHEAAMEQLRKEFGTANDAISRENNTDNGAVHEAGSNVVEERKDRPAE